MRRSSEAFRRAQDRRRRQDEARRLRDAVPRLDSLVLDVLEERVGMPGHEVQHRRVVIVGRAPALFEFPCSDRSCEEGGHDVTSAVLTQLARGEVAFSGESRCHGRTHGRPCDYRLRYQARAGYRATEAHQAG